MGKHRDDLVDNILDEAKLLRGLKKQGRAEDFVTQSSILEVCEPDEEGGCKGQGDSTQKQLVRKLGLNATQYLPLVPTRVYGRSDRVPVLNLTGPLKHHIVYSAANNVILLDYIKDQQIILQGHKNKIVALTKDKENKYFASGDWGPRSTVIIWDIFSGTPYQTLQLDSIHNSNGVAAIAFLDQLHYIAVLGAEKNNHQVVSIWPFEAKLNKPRKPACHITIPHKIGYQHEISFHPERNDFFVTTGHRGVAFYTWNRSEKKITYHVPRQPSKFISRMKSFTHSIWSFDHSRVPLTTTMAGFIVVWDAPSPIGLVEPPDLNRNVKEYKRCYKIGTSGLTSFLENQGLYVIGDDAGVIRFFDKQFRLVQWTKFHKLPPIHFIAFNELRQQTPDFQRAMRDRYDYQQKTHIHKEKSSYIRDYTLGMKHYHQPSEATIERAAFYCSDFFIGAAHGNVYYYHLAEERLDIVVHGGNSRFVACDVNQVSNHMAVVTYKGEIHLYDTKTHRVIYRHRLFKKPTRVSCLKFHPSGAFVFIGGVNGRIYYRRAFNFKPIDSPLDNARTEINSIVFSEDGLFMAYFDKSRAVGLYVNLPRKASWVFKGKQRMHRKPIAQVMFYMDKVRNTNRLFSLGTDRRIIEYDIPNSSLGSGLQALTVTRIEQFSVPRCMTLAEPFPNLKPHIVISDNCYKLSVYDPDDRVIRRTCQGPIYGVPINKMASIKPDGRMPGGRVFTLFVSGNKLGLLKPPIDGNPYKCMAVLTHPAGVKELATSFDHKNVYSIGNNETICIQWRTNVPALESQAVSGGSGTKPFLKMLERNMPEGKSLVEECKNSFVMLMLQKVSSSRELLTSDLKILVKEIPSVARFCGYFPTEYEIDLMIEEAEFAGVIDHGERNEEINFEDFIRLFANHRRFHNFNKATYAAAFRKIAKHSHGDPVVKGHRFKRLLTTRGERISDIDLPIYIPHLFHSVIETEYVPHHVSLEENETSLQREQSRTKRKVIKKEIVEVIKGKAFLDHAYSRSVALPMTWTTKEDRKAEGKMTAILAHLTKQRMIPKNLPPAKSQTVTKLVK